MESEPSSQTFMFRTHPIPSCDSEGVKIQLHCGEARPSDFAGRLSSVSYVHTKVHVSTHTSVQRHCVWMTTSYYFIQALLGPYHSNSPLSPDKVWYHVMLLVKVLRTQVHMSSRSSVQSHCHFEHYFQSLCHDVLSTV